MLPRTPVERAVDVYSSDWPTTPAHCPGIARVNPETLTARTSPDFAFRYIDIGSVTRGTIEWGAVEEISFRDAPSRARRVVRRDDVLLSTVRPLLGSHTYAGWTDDVPTVCSTGFAVLRCQDGLLPRFAKHLPFSEPVTRQLVAWQCGTNYPAVNERDVRRLILPLPPHDEQEGIAGVLDAIDAARERAAAAATAAAELERSTLADAFEALDAEWHRLGAFTRELRYGTSRAASDRGWGHPVLRIPNVIGDRLNLDDLASVELPPTETDRLRLADGDLLLVRTNGNPNYVGRSVVFRPPDSRLWVYASYLIRVRLRDDEVSPEYVNVFLGTARGRQELLRRVTTSAGNHNINANSIRLLAFPVPRQRRDQDRIVELASVCRENVDALTAKVCVLAEVKLSVMDDILTGRVRVGDAAGAVAA